MMPRTKVIELRNYLLGPGRTRDFIRYFEEHFLLSQRAEGMHPLGQFEVVGEPDRFVWIRGFDDMRARFRGLDAFYSGPFWQARREEANAMMREHHNVHLLRPLGSVAALTGGATLEDRASEPPGAGPPETGLVVADFYHTEPAKLGRLVELFEQRVRPILLEQGHHVLGHFVTELRPNDYPRLPVVQDPTLLVILSAYRDRERCAAMRHDWRNGGPVVQGGMEPLLTGEAESTYLRPTARSLIRYHGDGAP
jgi:quinol monooxygenase YgiN